MKKRMDGRMKDYQLKDGSLLLEIGGELLIHVPSDLEGKREYSRGLFLCSLEEGTTRRGRRIIRLRPGGDFYVAWGWCAGSRSWCGWSEWPDHPEIRAWAAPTSKGGGCWWEAWIWPSRFGRTWEGTWRPDPDRIRLEELEEEIGGVAPEQS